MRNDLVYRGVTYDDDALREISAAVDTSLNERTLDVDTIQLVVKDPTGAVAAASQDYPVTFLRGGSQYSLSYLQSTQQLGEAFFLLKCISSLGRLLQMPHRGGVYNGVAASVILDDIFGVVPHYIAPAFRNILLYGWLPNVSPSGEDGAQQGTAKDNLLQVLFAINAAIRDDAQGILRVENLSTAVSSQLDADRVFRGTTTIRHELPITSVTVLEHQFIPGGQLTTLFEGTTTEGQVIVFDAPMSNLVATGFTITESNANYAVVSAGTGTLTGEAYIHTTREVTKAVTEAAIPNPVRIATATLVGLTNSAEVVNRLADYYAHRDYIECEASIVYEDAGDVVELWDAFSKTMRQACIEQISPLRASNIMRGTISALIGFVPWQVVPFEDVRELLTGSGTWTVPEGVTEVTVVLIGGGQGGSAGNQGSSAASPSIQSKSSSGVVQRWVEGTSAAGDGGAPGTPGAGGKILRIELTVSAGEAFSFSTGVGGEGSSDPETAGSDGTATTFGTYSSDSGASSTGGYTDPVTGTTYGALGAEGMPGNPGSSSTETPAPIVVDGVSYANGAKGSPSSHEWSYSYKTYRDQGNGAYGGGAAYKSAGNDGSSGITTTSVSEFGISSLARAGGMGADAAPPEAETIYGKGGTGGNGGGGRGAFGYAGAINIYNAAQTTPGTVTLTLYNPPGGAGSIGGEGAPGCIIAYYRRPVTE